MLFVLCRSIMHLFIEHNSISPCLPLFKINVIILTLYQPPSMIHVLPNSLSPHRFIPFHSLHFILYYSDWSVPSYTFLFYPLPPSSLVYSPVLYSPIFASPIMTSPLVLSPFSQLFSNPLPSISGNEEGGFGWIAFNYLKKVIGPKKVRISNLFCGISYWYVFHAFSVFLPLCCLSSSLCLPLTLSASLSLSLSMALSLSHSISLSTSDKHTNTTI